jgi:hypothetical protein
LFVHNPYDAAADVGTSGQVLLRVLHAYKLFPRDVVGGITEVIAYIAKGMTPRHESSLLVARYAGKRRNRRDAEKKYHPEHNWCDDPAKQQSQSRPQSIERRQQTRTYPRHDQNCGGDRHTPGPIRACAPCIVDGEQAKNRAKNYAERAVARSSHSVRVASPEFVVVRHPSIRSANGRFNWKNVGPTNVQFHQNI